MKAQEMPMKTIVFVIIALVVIVAVVIWYITTSGTIDDSTSNIFDLGDEQSKIKCVITENNCPPGYECNTVCNICVPIGSPCPS